MTEEQLKNNANTIIDGEIRGYEIAVAKGPEKDADGNELPHDALSWWSRNWKAFPHLSILMTR